MIKRIALIMFSVLLIASTVFASNSSDEAEKWTPFEFGTARKPIQLFGTDANVYGLRLGLFHARNKNIVGVDFGPAGYSKVENNMTGLQAGAGVNHVGNRFRGLQTAGLTNITEGESYGMQLAGVANVAKEGVLGPQVAGLYNLGDPGAGLQLTGGLNYTRVSLLQAAGLGNITFMGKSGLQLAGGVNFAGFCSFQIAGVGNVSPFDTPDYGSRLQLATGVNFTKQLKGVQISGLSNVARGDSTGLQISGIFNKAANMTGVQLGLINDTESLKGLQIGALNIVRDAETVPALPIIYGSF